jgi:phage baseplate assembly protein W
MVIEAGPPDPIAMGPSDGADRMTGEATGKEFMGRGWAYPFRVEPASGRIATVADETDIQESIRIIVCTAKGERVMRPAFGCGIYDLVHGAIDMATIVRIKREVAEALRLYEARIDVLAVKVDASNLFNGNAQDRARLPRPPDQPARQLRLSVLLQGGALTRWPKACPWWIRAAPRSCARRSPGTRACLRLIGRASRRKAILAAPCSKSLPGWPSTARAAWMRRRAGTSSPFSTRSTWSRRPRSRRPRRSSSPWPTRATRRFSAPARVQLTAESGDEELTFETRAAIDLTPARVGNLIIADPATDVIERAPPYVTRSVDKLQPPTSYLLLSAVEAGATAIQLVQGVGIEPGDLLRLPGGVYRVDKVKDGLVQLRDELVQGVPAQTNVDKLIALESFAQRNLQEHAVYFGHKEMLKLDGAAAITLVFDPPTLPAVLAGLDLDYEIWGTREGIDTDAGWRPLELRGAGASGLVLEKTWVGSVDELELAAGKSRWVRIKLKTPIEGACGPPTGPRRSSSRSARRRRPRRRTATAARRSRRHSTTASRCRPQPRSCRSGPSRSASTCFSLSAPEALSKKGATVTLDVTMVGANLQSMTWVAGAPGHIYGISSTGRLQAVYLDDAAPSWRQLGLAPPPEAGADAAGGAGTVEFDASMPLAAVRLSSTQERIFVRDATNRLMHARVDKVGADWTIQTWNVVAPPQGEELLAFCLLVDSPSLPGATSYWRLFGRHPRPDDRGERLPCRLAVPRPEPCRTRARGRRSRERREQQRGAGSDRQSGQVLAR